MNSCIFDWELYRRQPLASSLSSPPSSVFDGSFYSSALGYSNTLTGSRFNFPHTAIYPQHIFPSISTLYICSTPYSLPWHAYSLSLRVYVHIYVVIKVRYVIQVLLLAAYGYGTASFPSMSSKLVYALVIRFIMNLSPDALHYTNHHSVARYNNISIMTMIIQSCMRVISDTGNAQLFQLFLHYKF